VADKDYYKVLGVKRSATKEEIQQAYRKLVRQYHPDLNPNDKQAEEKFKEVNEAYQVLNDPNRRKEYEATLKSGGGPSPRSKGTSQAQRKPSSTAGPSQATMPADPLSSLLDQMRQRAASNVAGTAAPPTGARSGASSRQDLEAELWVTPEEACNGAVKTLNVEGRPVKVRVPAGTRENSLLPLTVRVRVRR